MHRDARGVPVAEPRERIERLLLQQARVAAAAPPIAAVVRDAKRRVSVDRLVGLSTTEQFEPFVCAFSWSSICDTASVREKSEPRIVSARLTSSVAPLRPTCSPASGAPRRPPRRAAADAARPPRRRRRAASSRPSIVTGHEPTRVDVNALAIAIGTRLAADLTRSPAQASASRAYVAAPEIRAGSRAPLLRGGRLPTRPRARPWRSGSPRRRAAVVAPRGGRRRGGGEGASASPRLPRRAAPRASARGAVLPCARRREHAVLGLSATSGSAPRRRRVARVEDEEEIPLPAVKGSCRSSRARRTSSDHTPNLLLGAMKDSGKSTFLIDGFPRNKENATRGGRRGTTATSCSSSHCPEDVMLRRLLGRNEGRTVPITWRRSPKRFKTVPGLVRDVVQYQSAATARRCGPSRRRRRRWRTPTPRGTSPSSGEDLF